MAATTMHTDRVVISDEQFEKLVELLTPGYECSKLMLAELHERDAMRQKWQAEQGVPAQTDTETGQAAPSFDLPADGGLAAPDTATEDHGA